MEVLKIVFVSVAVSLGLAAGITLLVGWGMDSLESLRQRWVARERDAVKIVHA